ncbi:dennd5b, partial [Symbiodinium microadriaticum]
DWNEGVAAGVESGFHDHVLDSPTSDQTTGGAYPEVAPPASCFAPRPPAELPSRSTGRRAQGERATCQTPRQKGGSTSLPPVPLTARERHWQSSDPGASGSSVSSARRSLPERDGRSSSQHARTVTGAPSKESGTKSEPSRKLAQTTKPPSRETASPVFAGYSSAPSPESHESESREEGPRAWEMPSCPSPAIMDVLSDALGQEDVRRNSFHDIISEMEREKELWNEKMVALLSSSPNPPVTAPSSDPSQLPSNTAATDEAEVPSELDMAPPPLTVEPLKDVDLGESVIARAMREAGMDPESTSMVDLFATASDADLAEEISEVGLHEPWRLALLLPELGSPDGAEEEGALQFWESDALQRCVATGCKELGGKGTLGAPKHLDPQRPIVDTSRRDSTLAALFMLSAMKGADTRRKSGVACAVSGPIWGNLVDSGASRKWLLQVGAGLWGLCTIQLALTSNFVIMIVLRAASLHVPVMQSFVADLTTSSNCGSAFGKVACAANVGQVLACLMVTPISETVVHGVRGWRLSLAFVGVLSLFCAPRPREAFRRSMGAQLPAENSRALKVLFVRVAVHEEPTVWKPRQVPEMPKRREPFLVARESTFHAWQNLLVMRLFSKWPSTVESSKEIRDTSRDSHDGAVHEDPDLPCERLRK